MSQMMPPSQQGMMGVRPHRGTAVLVLGILGIVICGICGIIAWVMGNNDLREMAAGRMDRSGEGITKAGKICGIIGTIWGCLCLCLGILWVIVVFVAVGAAAAGGAAGAAGSGGTP